jgi:hypothetical protein
VKAVPASAQEQISAVLGRDQHAFQAAVRPGGFELDNPKHRLAAEFTGAGIRLKAGTSHWGMTLQGYGYGDKLIAGSVVRPQATANRVEYRRGALTEWYVNGPLGLEQGFNVTQSPGKSRGEPLTLAFSLSGELAASVDPGGHGLTLSRNGIPALRYGGLVAHDATGRELRAWMETAGERLWLRVDDAGARFPVVVDPVIQEATLTSLVGEEGDLFGGSVAVDGDTIVIGAPAVESGVSTFPGAAYVFVNPGTWSGAPTETAKLSPPSGSGSGFGDSVAISGDTIVVGQNNFPGSSPVGASSAYVFVKHGSAWATTSAPDAQLNASDAVVGDRFGRRSAISGDTIVVGANNIGTDNTQDGKGAAYVFVKPSGGWGTAGTTPQLENAKLVASDSLQHDDFGSSLGISGDTIVVGAPGPNQAAYVFVKPSGGWGNGTTTLTENAKLTPSGGAGGAFGNAVAISGDTIVGGAVFDTVGSNASQGSVCVFVKPVGGWVSASENAKLIASDGAANNVLGEFVSIDGDTVVAIAQGPGSSQNQAYAFVKPPGGWSGTVNEIGKLINPSTSGEFNAIALSGTTMVLGAESTTIGSNNTQGEALVASVTSQATPVITWPTPSPITYGTAISATQLNATANTTGTFAYDQPLGAILPAGSHTLNLTFTPDDTTDFTTATASVTLVVNQATPVIVWTPASIQLGLSLGALQLDATANVPGAFVYTPPAGTAVTTTSQTVSVAFTPADTTDYTSANASVALTVTAGPLASVSPTSIDFGTLYLGSIVTRNVTVSNVGNAAMTITNPFLSQLHGGNSNEYVVVSLCPKSLAAGKSCTMTVAFVAGPFYAPQTATLNVMDNAPGNPQTVTLTALVIDPHAALSTNNLNFGSQKVNTASAPRIVTLKNTGATALTITGVTVAGANPSDFPFSNGCTGPLAPGASCAVSVTFAPTAKNSRSATLKIADNAQSGTQSVGLSGTGK